MLEVVLSGVMGGTVVKRTNEDLSCVTCCVRRKEKNVHLCPLGFLIHAFAHLCKKKRRKDTPALKDGFLGGEWEWTGGKSPCSGCPVLICITFESNKYFA